MQKNIKEKGKKRSVTDKYKDDVICYVGVEVVLCR
jgi:hypothetical protein